jgi:hypothetical protein
MSHRLDLAAAFAAALAFSAAAAPSAAAQTGAVSAELVVTGERLRELAQAYAGAVALTPDAGGLYGRWNERICPSVAGLSATEAQTLIDHIARRAHETGLSTGGVGCAPNTVIIFASDADAVAREIVDTRRDLLGYYSEDDVVTAGRDALEAFASSHRAVRWWHVSNRTTADGRRLGDNQARRGGGGAESAAANSAAASGNPSAGLSAGGFEGVESVRSQGTRMRRATRQDLSFALVIVDARRVFGLPPQAVADYVAMATLVQLDPDADMTAFHSILNLFAERPGGQAAPTAMTDWDLAYLRGLYGATREAANAGRQRTDIARRMAERMAPE